MRILLLLVSIASVLSDCNIADHHPENGGYFFVGVGGESDTTNLDSAHGQKLENATWVPGQYYPYGESKTCDPEGPGYCSSQCSKAPGCKQFLNSHTCSILKFCPPEGASASRKIHLMKDFESADTCNFSEAQELGEMGTHHEEDCFEYVFEEDHELTEYYFASEEGCAEGQKVAVQIQDFSMTASQCRAIGLTTSRIRNCDCRLQKKASTLGEPCRTAFSDSCQDAVLEGACCDDGTCISKYEDFNHPEGYSKEVKRRDQCDNLVPGVCYNADGVGNDVDGLGSKDCCKQKCSSCGTEMSPRALWKPCTAMDADSKIGKCGFLGRYDRTPFECDFSKCGRNDYWFTEGTPFKYAAGISTSTTPAPTPASASSVVDFGNRALTVLFFSSMVFILV